MWFCCFSVLLRHIDKEFSRVLSSLSLSMHVCICSRCLQKYAVNLKYSCLEIELESKITRQN